MKRNEQQMAEQQPMSGMEYQQTQGNPMMTKALNDGNMTANDGRLMRAS